MSRKMSRLGQRVVPHIVKNEIEAALALGEVLLGVVDHVVGADRSDHLDVPRAAHSGHFGTKCLAICTANVPTPPEAPVTSTFCPGRTLP